MEYEMANKICPASCFESSDIYRRYSIIKCLNEFLNGFLSKCIANISNSWRSLVLKLIPVIFTGAKVLVKCLNEFLKKFLSKCIAKISDA